MIDIEAIRERALRTRLARARIARRQISGRREVLDRRAIRKALAEYEATKKPDTMSALAIYFEGGEPREAEIITWQQE
jgi:hypothetical protein